MEEAEHLLHVTQICDTYKKRKETIEQVFADAKERHCLRYTNYRGLAKVKMQCLFSPA
ncbi:MAG: transposase [Selenomonadaceae bacterium]|nr:transposase [Selenomonadaceae bacterium]